MGDDGERRDHADGAAARKATIRDVAALVGVSPSTVSRAFSLPDRVNSATAKRIFEAARTIGYHDERIESRSSGRATKLAGIIVPDIANQFFSNIIRNVERELQREGISLMVAESQESARAERAVFDRLAPYADGVILASSRMPDAMIRKCAQTRPLIVVNRNVLGVSGVVIDATGGIRAMLRYLAERGHRRIVYLDGPASSWSAGVRWKTLKAECAHLGIVVRRLWPGVPTFDGGAAMAERFLEAPASAVIAHNDLMAAGFMTAMRARGYACPQDYSILGFDDGMVARICDPAITSINVSTPELGRYAARMLLRRLSGQSDCESVAVPSSLTVRESVAGVSDAFTTLS